MQFTVTARGQVETFDSPYSHVEAANRLTMLVLDRRIKSTFAADLVQTIRRKGLNRLSDRQLPWVHKMVVDAETPRSSDGAATVGLQSIVTHLANCQKSREEGGKGLLHPKVMVKVGDQVACLKLCGKNSKHRGKVSVASDPKFGQGTFYGYIGVDGKYEHRNTTNPEVVAILQRIAVDPAAVISQLGRESGVCCYCFMRLTTVQSKIAGCGPDCSESYGAWYPNAAETRDYLQDHPQVLEGATDADRWV